MCSFDLTCTHGQELLEALKAGAIAGAVLDVYDGEFAGPPPEELWRLPNVLITPHTSGRTDPEFVAEHGRGMQLFAQELLPAFPAVGETVILLTPPPPLPLLLGVSKGIKR